MKTKFIYKEKVESTKTRHIVFSDLNKGDIFTSDEVPEELLMRTQTFRDDEYSDVSMNTVSLSHGDFMRFEDDEKVNKYEGTFTVNATDFVSEVEV